MLSFLTIRKLQINSIITCGYGEHLNMHARRRDCLHPHRWTSPYQRNFSNFRLRPHDHFPFFFAYVPTPYLFLASFGSSLLFIFLFFDGFFTPLSCASHFAFLAVHHPQKTFFFLFFLIFLSCCEWNALLVVLLFFHRVFNSRFPAFSMCRAPIIFVFIDVWFG